MAKKQQPKHDHRLQIVNLKRQNVSFCHVAIQLGCSVKTVQKEFGLVIKQLRRPKEQQDLATEEEQHHEDRKLVLPSRLSIVQIQL